MPPEDQILEAAGRLFGYRSLRPGRARSHPERAGWARHPCGYAHGRGQVRHLRAGRAFAVRANRGDLAPHRPAERSTGGPGSGGKLSAVALNSGGTARERQHVLDQLSRQERSPDFVFLAPEQLANGEVRQRLAELRPVLLAVDEAHLVSRWGLDFRPDYLRIGPALERLGRPTVLAVTATAAPAVRDEIVQRLQMRTPAVLVRGFSRDNIRLAVHGYFVDESHKLEVLQENVIEAVRDRGHGIVYGATHHRVETVAANLSAQGVRAAPYHAGLPNPERSQIEHRFHDDELDVVVATIAFGMGIDKPDVRWVFHADVSGSLDEYYQEFGRAGRDGGPSDAVLYFPRRGPGFAAPVRGEHGTKPSGSRSGGGHVGVGQEPDDPR